VLSLRHSLKNKPVNKLTRKPNANASPGLRRLRLLLANEIVKRPIQMRQRNIHRNTSNRKLNCRSLRPLRSRPRFASRRTSSGHEQVLAVANDG